MNIKHPFIAEILTIIALVAAPFVLPHLGFSPTTINRILIWGLFGVGFDLLFGYTGLLSFGQPFEGLAPIIVQDLVHTCRELARSGQTIVVVEQNLAATLALEERVYILNNGHIAHEGPPRRSRRSPTFFSATWACSRVRLSANKRQLDAPKR